MAKGERLRLDEDAGVDRIGQNRQAGDFFAWARQADSKVALRLPPEQREAFLKKYKTTLCEAYGVVQKEYVEVPDALLKKTSELKKFFAVSFAYVGSLKPKATTRKKVS